VNGRIRLLLSDVDGTLVTPDKVLTEATLAAARDLKQAGIAFAIGSSRPPRGMARLIAPLALQTPLAAFNGGMLVNSDLSVITSHVLALATARKVVDLFQAHGLDTWVYDAQEWFVLDKDAPYIAREMRTIGFAPTVVASFDDTLLSRAAKIAGASGDFTAVAACTRAAQEALGDDASATSSQNYIVEVTHQLANKGEVVAELSRRLNIPLAEIATIGDGGNDVFMFRKSGFSIAMGNATEAVKAEAKVVTDSNEQDGFAKAVRTFILNAAMS
jgi:hypothetical protein